MTKNKSIQLIGRIITASVVLGITAFFTPDIGNPNFLIVIIGIFSLSLFDFLISSYTKIFSNQLVKGIIAFVLCSITLYIIQYIMIGYSLSWISAILGALVYSIAIYML